MLKRHKNIIVLYIPYSTEFEDKAANSLNSVDQ